MTDKYCVIGNPIAHSKSPEIHAAYAAATGQDIAYERCLAPLDGFAATVRDLVARGYRGANVTVPFKLEAAGLADILSERARVAGAVNTLIFEDGRIIGDNTDGEGLAADIVRNAGMPLTGKRILLLGAGGAARGVLQPFLKQGPAVIIIANRTQSTLQALLADIAKPPQLAMPGQVGITSYEEITASFDIVINATSASLSSAMPPVPAAAFGPDTLALDMMYGAAPTPFLAFAAAQGARTRDGLGMLVEQAAEAFAIWRGVRPSTAAVLDDIRAKL
jgi:shikimate dehydrogenase